MFSVRFKLNAHKGRKKSHKEAAEFRTYRNKDNVFVGYSQAQEALTRGIW